MCCPELVVHGEPMKTSESEKYLGSLITTDMNLKQTIETRANSAIGVNSQIMSILNAVSLGSHFFTIAKVLRESMLINTILVSSEAWYHTSEQEIRKLEEADESLLRNILNSHSKTALEALYLELKCLPIRYHIMYRRLNFYHYILSLNNSELLARFFKGQQENP